MTTKARLASLVVDLQLESAELRKGLDEANRRIESFAKTTESAAGLIAGAFAFDQLKDGALWLAGFVKGGADATVAMGNMAKAAGTPVEEFSKLAYAAERFGFESDNLAESFGQLAEYMAEAKAGSAEHVALFKALGISVTGAGGHLRSTGDVFKDLAQRFSETQDGAAKTALAVKFFGEEGIKLIPTLNLGRAGLARFGEEAERTGKVVTEEGAAGAERFDKALKKLEGAAQGLANKVAQDLAPSLAAFAEEVTTSKDSAAAFETVATALSTALRVLATAGVAVATTFEVVGKAAAGAAAWTAALFDDDALSSASGEAGMAAGKSLADALKEEGRKFRAIWDKDGPGAALEKDAEKAKPSADAMVDAIERQKKAAERAAEAQKKLGEAAKKAAEDAGRALDEYVKAQLGLERQQQAIGRDIDRRRAAANGEDPTSGFSGLDDALEKLEKARRLQATFSQRAADREKEGDITGAHADAVKVDLLKEMEASATRAVDAFAETMKAAGEAAGRAIEEEAAARVERERELARQRAEVPQELAGMLAPSGPAVSATLQGAQTGAAAGPWGAAAGALMGLVSQSETFQGALEQLESIFQALANSVGLLVEPLLPLLTVVSEVAAGLGALIGALSPIIEWVARPLFEVFKGFGLVVLNLVNFVGSIINQLGRLFGFKNSLDLSGIGEAMMRLRDTSYESAKEQTKVAEAARQAAEGVANVPSWYRVEAGRFNATRPEGGSGGGSTVVNDSSTTNIALYEVADPKTVAKEIREALDKKGVRGKGSRFDDEEMP